MTHYRRTLTAGLPRFRRLHPLDWVGTKYVRSVRVHILPSKCCLWFGFLQRPYLWCRATEATSRGHCSAHVISPATARRAEFYTSTYGRRACQFHFLVDRPPIKGSSSERGRRSQSATAEVVKHSIPLPLAQWRDPIDIDALHASQLVYPAIRSLIWTGTSDYDVTTAAVSYNLSC